MYFADKNHWLIVNYWKNTLSKFLEKLTKSQAWEKREACWSLLSILVFYQASSSPWIWGYNGLRKAAPFPVSERVCPDYGSRDNLYQQFSTQHVLLILISWTCDNILIPLVKLKNSYLHYIENELFRKYDCNGKRNFNLIPLRSRQFCLNWTRKMLYYTVVLGLRDKYIHRG